MLAGEKKVFATPDVDLSSRRSLKENRVLEVALVSGRTCACALFENNGQRTGHLMPRQVVQHLLK